MTTSINERTHFFIKIYLSHFILERVAKGLMLVMCERWAGDGDRLQHIDPKVFSRPKQHFFLWADQPEVAEGPSPLSGAGSHSGILSPTGTATRTPTATATRTVLTRTLPRTPSAWLTQVVCGIWLYNCWSSTCFLWAYASAAITTTSTSQGDIRIYSTGCTCFLIDGSVEGQYVTIWPNVLVYLKVILLRTKTLILKHRILILKISTRTHNVKIQ